MVTQCLTRRSLAALSSSLQRRRKRLTVSSASSHSARFARYITTGDTCPACNWSFCIKMFLVSAWSHLLLVWCVSLAVTSVSAGQPVAGERRVAAEVCCLSRGLVFSVCVSQECCFWHKVYSLWHGGLWGWVRFLIAAKEYELVRLPPWTSCLWPPSVRAHVLHLLTQCRLWLPSSLH